MPRTTYNRLAVGSNPIRPINGMIEKFLNIRYSTRNLSNEEFELVLPILAKELSETNYNFNYTEKQLRTDWQKLISWNPSGNLINSTNRVGMKLCEQFFPNFYSIEDNQGKSFSSLWKDPEFLQKVIRWNRKSHSTPYISELKRGVYFCGGLPKSTMYRPQLAKMVTRGSSFVLDPCAGWGGRMLGVVSNGSHYIGFEPNTKTYENLLSLVKYLNIENSVTLLCDDALNLDKYDFPQVQTILTSPPYFDLEIYTHENTQSIKDCSDYKSWENKFFIPLMSKCISRLSPTGKSCWNVAKIKSADMWDTVLAFHASIGYHVSCEYSVMSSTRQSNKTNTKSTDKTICFQKHL